MRWILTVVLFIAAVLGYGYWHARTHGTLSISIYDASQQGLFVPLKDVEVSLLDSGGGVLARGGADPRYGAIHLSHPVHGSCVDAERDAMYSNQGANAWQKCFARLSTWIMEWIDNVRFIDVYAGECELRGIPAVVSTYSEDWWLWWIPLPHVGGKPYSYFKIVLRIDPDTCKLIN